MMPRSFAGSNRALLAHLSLRPLLSVLPLLAGSAVACGANPAAPQAPALSAAPLASVALPAAPDLSPVPPPPGLVVSGSLSKLGASLAVVQGWTQFPMPQSEQVTEILASEGLGPVVDLDRPIDFAVAVAGTGARLSSQIAVAAGIRDLDAAKAALAEHHKLVPGDNGVLLIQGASARGAKDDDKSDDGDDDARACELAPSYGASAFRLVCAWDPKALALLGPWLTRGATRQTTAYDAHVDVRMQPIKPAIAEERRLLSMLLGTVLGGRLGLSGVRELAQSVGADLADFATDLDTTTLDVSLSGPGAAATLTLKLSGAASALGRLATANADRNGPPPAAFWQMPADADFALFDRGIGANELARGRDLALKVVSDQLADDGVKDADRHAITEALGPLVSSAPTVYASGVDLDAASKALAAEKALGDAADLVERRTASRATAEAFLGWRVVEVDEPAAARIDALKAFTAAWSRPAVSAAYHAHPGARVLAIRNAPLPKGSSLPKDTQHFAIDLPLPEPIAGAAPKGKARPAGASKPLAIEVFIAPDGARSWIGVGGDPALVSAKLAAAIAGSGAALSSRPELASFKDAIVGAGGFFTARSLPETGELFASLGGDPGGLGTGAELFEGNAQLPHQGTTPIPFTLTAPAATPGTVAATLQVSRGTVDDVVATILKHGF